MVYVNEEVLGFEVPVSDVLAVAKSDRLQDLLGHVSSFVLRKLLARGDFLEQLAPVTKLGHKEDIALILIHFIKTNNVRVVQVLENFDFILHADAFGIIKLKLVDDFDGSLLLVRLHCGLFDFSKCALSEDVVVQFVLVHKYLHILILHDEVFVRGDHFLNILVNFLLLNFDKLIFSIGVFAT